MEIGYMLGSRAGPQAEADFLHDIADGVYTVESMYRTDIERAAHLVEKYADLPLGTADACVVALAERLGVTRIATLDTRHATFPPSLSCRSEATRAALLIDIYKRLGGGQAGD